MNFVEGIQECYTRDWYWVWLLKTTRIIEQNLENVRNDVTLTDGGIILSLLKFHAGESVLEI